MPISAILVDDEPLAREELAFLLRDFPEVHLVASGKNGLEAVQLTKEHRPDLLFLDVQMPGLDGFGVIERLLEKRLPLPYIVFATAFDQYAVQAFEINAVDYLLKPFDKERLGRTLQRVRAQMRQQEPAAEKIDRVLHLLEEKKGAPPRLLLKAGGRHLLLDPREIVFARIEDGIVTVVASHAEGQASFRTLDDLQVHLNSPVFWRAHRSYLVNLNRIKEVVPWFNSSYQLRMDDAHHTEVPVSRTQSRALRELFNL